MNAKRPHNVASFLSSEQKVIIVVHLFYTLSHIALSVLICVVKHFCTEAYTTGDYFLYFFFNFSGKNVIYAVNQ
jgi:hypothetical protein